MKSKKGFSIIIPCYNSGEYIIEAVQSILKQDFKRPFEIIVVDDGSNDTVTKKSLETVSSYKNLILIKIDKNKGAQFARNVGIRKSKYEFLFCLDSDDKLNIDSMVLRDGSYPDLAIDMLEKNEDIAFVHGISLMFEGFNGFTISAYPVSEKLILRKHHVQNSILYRKEDALEAGLYDESISKWQDWSFAVGILNSRLIRGKQNIINFIDKPFYLYRIHDGVNRISAKKINEEEMIQKTINRSPEIFKKYYQNTPFDLIAKAVLKNKPDKVTDLLFIASHNLSRALEISKERGFKNIQGENLNIP